MDAVEIVDSFNKWTPATTGEVVAAADAMRRKREELIDQPLAVIYVQLARTAIDAAAAFRATQSASS